MHDSWPDPFSEMKRFLKVARMIAAPLAVFLFLSLNAQGQEMCNQKYEIEKTKESLYRVIDCETNEVAAVFDRDPRLEAYSPPQPSAYPQLAGFPIYYYFARRWNPIVGDIYDSGNKEVALNVGYDPSTLKLYMYDSSGQLKNNFPIQSGTLDISAYDYGQDGSLDIYYRYSDYNKSPVSAGLGCVDGNANQLPNWPQLGPLSNSIEDVNSDGIAEVFSPSFSGTSTYYARVYGYDEQGNIFQGWPKDFNYKESSPQISMTAIADLDNDGQKEIIVSLYDSATTILALKADGSDIPGFPVSLNLGKSNGLLVGDLDSNGWNEIVFRAGGWIGVLSHDGTMKPGWPKPTDFGNYESECQGSQMCGGASGVPALADLNRDSMLEIICGTGNTTGNALLFIFNPDGTYYPGWPQLMSTANLGFRGVAVGDVDGDCIPDLVFAAYNSPSNQSGLYGYHIDGTTITNFPLYVATDIMGAITPVLTDLNNDGYLDIGIVTDSTGTPFGTLEFFDLTPNPYNRSCIEWPMAHFDIRNTGRYRKLYQIDKDSAFGVDKLLMPADGESRMFLTACAATEGALPSNFNGDLSGQDVRFARNPVNGTFTGPIIDHLDGSYSRYLVAPFSDDPLTTNLMCWINEFKLNTIIPVTFLGRPVIESYSPRIVPAGHSYTVSLTGRNFPADASAVSDSPKTQLTGFNRVSDTSAEINVNVLSDAIGYQPLRLFGYERYSDPIYLIAYQPGDLLLLGDKPTISDANMQWYGLDDPPGINFRLTRATKRDLSDGIIIYEGTDRSYTDSAAPAPILYYKIESE